MTFDEFKILENCYKDLSQGIWKDHIVKMVYQSLPDEFQVDDPSRDDTILAIKSYYETELFKALSILFPNGLTGETSSQK